MHPWACDGCSPANDPSVTQVSRARLEAIYPPSAGDAHHIALVYEDEADAASLCADLVEGSSSCIASRGLLAEVKLVWSSAGTDYHGGGIQLRYRKLAAGTGAAEELLLKQVVASATGEVLSLYEYDEATRPAQLVTVRDAVCSTEPLSCTTYTYGYTTAGNDFHAMNAVQQPVRLDSGSLALRDVETFTWSGGNISAHESPGIALAHVSGTSTSATWLKNGVNITTDFDGYGNPVSCTDGSCSAIRDWDTSPQGVARGVRSERTKQGLWILRQHNDQGQVELEAVVDYDSTIAPTLSLNPTTDPDVETVTVSAGNLLRATRCYYNQNHQLWVVARSTEHQPVADGIVRFPTDPGGCVPGSYPQGPNWFLCGTLTDRKSTYPVTAYFTIETGGTQYADVTVYDYDGDPFDGLNGPNDRRVVVTTDARVLSEDTYVSYRRQMRIETLDSYGRVSSVEREAGFTKERTELEYFDPVDTQVAVEERGRLKAVRVVTDLPSDKGYHSWRACASGAYDSRGRAKCYEGAQDASTTVPLTVEITHAHTLGSDGWLRTTTYKQGTTTLLSTEDRFLSSGFPIESRTTGGNRTEYRAAATPPAPATVGARPTVVRRLTSSGSQISKSETQYTAYGFVDVHELKNSANSARQRTDYDYVTSPLEPGPLPSTVKRYKTSTAFTSTTYTYNDWDAVSRMTEPDGTLVDYIYGLPGSGGDVGRLVEIRRGATTPSAVRRFQYDVVVSAAKLRPTGILLRRLASIALSGS